MNERIEREAAQDDQTIQADDWNDYKVTLEEQRKLEIALNIMFEELFNSPEVQAILAEQDAKDIEQMSKEQDARGDDQ